MLELVDIDLAADPAVLRYVKAEVVGVTFARHEGELTSQEGPNRYQAGDALVTGSTGNQWAVSRDRFDARYEPVSPTQAGEDGQYKAKPLPVLAKQMSEPFTAARSVSGDVLRGNAGDWLLQYGPGDFGIAEGRRFAKIYKKLAAEPSPPRSRNATLEALTSRYKAFKDCLPLAIGIHKAINERQPDVDAGQLRTALRIHTASTRYLKALSQATQRFDLDGLASGEVTAEQRKQASDTLLDRFRKKAEQHKEEIQARKLAQEKERQERQRQENLLKLAQKFNSR